MIEFFAMNWSMFLMCGVVSFLIGVVFILLLMGVSLNLPDGKKGHVIGMIFFMGGMWFLAACSVSWGLFLISMVVKLVVFVRG